MASKSTTLYEETQHYVNDPEGSAIVRFDVVNHRYLVTDEKLKLKNARMGGGTSLTGLMDKGIGLQMWPMWEMSKYLKEELSTKTLADLINDPDVTLDSLLQKGREAHEKKSDRGKLVGTDAHAWVEQYSKTLKESQDTGSEFIEPEILDVESIAAILRKAYMRIFNDLKPKDIGDFKALPKLFMQEIEMQQAIWMQADLARNSMIAAREWMRKHDIIVHGTEGTVYSREMGICGKYDSDWTVTCTEKCNWCFRNGDTAECPPAFTGRYIVDFKSTNASTDAPKGIYPEYLAQCGVYKSAIMEEFPDRKYTGDLIFNGAKEMKLDKKGNPYPVFSSHFSMNNERNQAWARCLSELKAYRYDAAQEIKNSR